MIALRDTVRTRSFPLVNWLLIMANAALFLLELSLGPQADALVQQFGLVPSRWLADPLSGQSITLVSSMFLHGSWLHFLSNMLALYIFGDNVEDRMGRMGYLSFYLLCGLAAGLTQIFFNTRSGAPMIGASGAIAGVLGAYLILYPYARVLTLIPVMLVPFFVEIPAILYLGFWFISQLFNGMVAVVSQVSGTVAWWAHAGGFLAGLFLVSFYLIERGELTPAAPGWAGRAEPAPVRLPIYIDDQRYRRW